LNCVCPTWFRSVVKKTKKEKNLWYLNVINLWISLNLGLKCFEVGVH
jgi:hypothetical protein